MNLFNSAFGIYRPLHKLSLLLSDLLCAALAFYLASQVRLNTTPNYFSLEYISLCAIIVSTLFLGGAYTSNKNNSAPKLPLRTFFVILASAIPCTLLIYILGPSKFTSLFGRGVFPLAIFTLAALAVLTRYFINNASIYKRQSQELNVLLLGETNPFSRPDKDLIKNLGFKLTQAKHISSFKHKLNFFSAVVIAPDHIPDDIEQQELINRRLNGTPIFSLSDFFEAHLFLVPVQQINNDWFIRTQGFTMLHSQITSRIKRIEDILITCILLTISLPIAILTAILIKLSSKGPVLFKQTRVGLNGSNFTIYKFRTMDINAEQNGVQWASKNDSRVTFLGHFLRKSRIDELPQCWNILKGEMSIIGPRPERPEFTSTLTKEIPYYDLRHIIKPGLTGWAQVSYPYGASTEDSLRKLQYDLYYIKNHSLLLDLNIIIRTLLTVFQRAGR